MYISELSIGRGKARRKKEFITILDLNLLFMVLELPGNIKGTKRYTIDR